MAEGIREGSDLTRANSLGLRNRARTALPIKWVVVSLPATRRSLLKLRTSEGRRDCSTVTPCRSTLIKSSPSCA